MKNNKNLKVIKTKAESKFYTFNQNNSGGSFLKDDTTGLTHYVCIEAMDADKANEKAESIGIYFNGCEYGMDCGCCGDRWYPVDESDGEHIPSIYGKPLEYKDDFFTDYYFVHYTDGHFEKFNFKK